MTTSEQFSVKEYDGGVLVIDSGYSREELAACYLVETGTELAFIEVGTNSSTPRLMKTLEMRGRKPEDVRYVIVTHVHLDHAGGAGSLMKLLPNATLLVHPYGSRHLIDPAKLEAGARAVYGDEVFEKIHGTLVPVDQQRVQVMEDGDEINLGDRQFQFMDTPGHARHHFCVFDSLTNGWFTGDTFGISYREFDTQNGAFILPTTTPIQFDPPALKASVKKLIANKPDFMYLTHYGRVDDIERLAARMLEGVDAFAAFGLRYEHDESRRQKIVAAMSDWLLKGLHEHDVRLPQEKSLDLLRDDIELNTQGIEFWLDHRKP